MTIWGKACHVQIVAAPFATGFDHDRIADEVQFKLSCATRAATGGASLPTFGVGHSMGSLLHILISCRYPVQRAGNVLMSFNNRDVLDAIPFFAPFIAPGARALAPILAQVWPYVPSFSSVFAVKTKC